MKKILKITIFIMFSIFIALLAGGAFIALLVGCASYVIRDGNGKIISQGEATGFLRTITVTEKLKAGKVIERKISTDSTTKDVLMGFNELIDTAVDTAGKIK